MTTQLPSLISSITKQPTSAADGRSAEAASGMPNIEKTSIVSDLASLGVKNGATILEAIPQLVTGDAINNKELLLEHGVAMLQQLPANSSFGAKASDALINLLCDDLPHPSLSLLGPSPRYRRHDGGGNSPWDTEMGKAGTSYAYVEDVYEALLKRKGPFRKHPSGLNRLFVSFATVVIHEIFQTNHQNQWINDTSSYVDLNTLYGNTEKEQARARYNNGPIYPDSIASERIIMMPPGVIAVLLLFSRNHNVIAEGLLSVNEDGRQDNEIFQLARNINVGFFASVVLRDYVAAILNTPRANSTWSLDLGKDIRKGGERVQRGTGNVVSVEFSVLYRWHAALSTADDKWVEDIIRSKNFIETEPRSWNFGGFERGSDRRFKDSDLTDLIKDCIEEPAHEFGAHGTPASMKIVNLMGQLQARNVFNVCTLNKFRRHLNLKSYKTFEAWNSDKESARAAELLYGNIKNLELYPSLIAKSTKPAMLGSSVCPKQTIRRGILNNAVSLIRGDWFLSYNFNSLTLTHWGMALL